MSAFYLMKSLTMILFTLTILNLSHSTSMKTIILEREQIPVISQVNCNSDDFEFSYILLENGKCELRSKEEEKSAITMKYQDASFLCVPSMLDGNEIIKIGKYAFYKMNFRAIYLPDTITTVDSLAFKDCSLLETIQIPPKVKSVSANTFENCCSLRIIEISSSLVLVDDKAAIGCSKKAKTLIYSSFLKIKESRKTKVLKAISKKYNESTKTLTITGDGIIPPQESNLPNYVYDVINIIINGPYEISSSAFYGGDYWTSYYKGLQNLTIGESVTSIKNSAITNIPSLREIKFLGSSVFRKFEPYSLNVGSDNLKIYYCSAQEPQMVSMSGGLESYIDKNPIIYVPSNYPSFRSSKSFLMHTANRDAVNEFLYDGGFSNYTYNGQTLYIRDTKGITQIKVRESSKTVNNKCNSCGFQNIQNIIGTSVSNIEASSFLDCSSLKTITFEYNTVSTINANTFKNCISLTSLPVLKSLNSINDNAFSGCSSLAGVIDLSFNSIAIGASAFEGCSSITGVLFSSKITTTGDYAFKGCTKLVNIQIKEGFQYISKECFYGCSSLKEIYLPSTLKSIYLDAFGNCISLRTVFSCTATNPSNHGKSTFRGCHDIKVIVPENYDMRTNFSDILPANLTKVSKADYSNGVNLTYIGTTLEVSGVGSTITSDFVTRSLASYSNPCLPTYTNKKQIIQKLILHEGIKSIGDNAFNGFAWISNDFVLPSTVESIGVGAFQGCSNIKGNIIFNNSKMNKISASSFKSCSQIAKLHISSHVVTIEQYAFYGCDNLREVIYCGTSDPATGSNQMPSGFYSSLVSVVSNYKGTAFCNVGLVNFNANSNYYTNGNQKLQYTIIGASLTIQPVSNFDAKNVTMDDVRGFSSLNERCLSCIGYQNIETVTLVDGIKHVNENSFSDCTSLTTVKFSNSLVELGKGSFLNCNKLNCPITLGANMKLIDQQAFRGCTSLVGPITINSDVFTTFEARAFQSCEKLSSVAIPASIVKIGDNAFKECSSLAEVIDLSHVSFTTLGLSAFERCTSITGVKLGMNISTIDIFTFKGCEKLSDVQMVDGIQNIYDSAFEGCSLIKEIYLPKTIKAIYLDAFKDCTGLRKITTCVKTNPIHINQLSFSGCHDVKVIVPPEYDINTGFCGIDSSNLTKVSKFDTTNVGINFTYIGSTLEISGPTESMVTKDLISQSVTSYNNPCLPSNLTKIEVIEALIINEGVTHIGDYSFKDYAWISNDITFPSTIKSIGIGAFEGCLRIKSVSFMSAMIMISNNTFRGCTNLATIVLPSSLTEIGLSAFENSGLTSIDLPISLGVIRQYAFKSCAYLESVTIAALASSLKLKDIKTNSLKTIETNAFLNCTSLKSINFGLVLEEIGSSAFKDTKISSIVFPSTLKEIGESAFANSSIEEVKIPSSVTRILPKAFESNALLYSVEYCGINDPAVTDNSQFENCPNLKNVRVPTTYKNQTFCGKLIDKSLKPEYCHVETMIFSFSEVFTISKSFAESSHFSNSFNFRSSHEFSQSSGFKATSAFKESDMFSNTVKFLKTNSFSGSNDFMKSKDFINTKIFSHSTEFSSTHDFTNTNQFISTVKFSSSSLFSSSEIFEHTEAFSNSYIFSDSKTFEAKKETSKLHASSPSISVEKTIKHSPAKTASTNTHEKVDSSVIHDEPTLKASQQTIYKSTHNQQTIHKSTHNQQTIYKSTQMQQSTKTSSKSIITASSVSILEEMSTKITDHDENAILGNVKDAKTGVMVGVVVAIVVVIIIVLIAVYIFISKRKSNVSDDDLNETAEMETNFATETLSESEIWTEFNTMTQDHTFYGTDQPVDEIFKDSYEEIFL